MCATSRVNSNSYFTLSAVKCLEHFSSRSVWFPRNPKHMGPLGNGMGSLPQEGPIIGSALTRWWFIFFAVERKRKTHTKIIQSPTEILKSFHWTWPPKPGSYPDNPQHLSVTIIYKFPASPFGPTNSIVFLKKHHFFQRFRFKHSSGLFFFFGLWTCMKTISTLTLFQGSRCVLRKGLQ